jgi:hypothetical protein
LEPEQAERIHFRQQQRLLSPIALAVEAAVVVVPVVLPVVAEQAGHTLLVPLRQSAFRQAMLPTLLVPVALAVLEPQQLREPTEPQAETHFFPP